jgi:deoxyribonuclease V
LDVLEQIDLATLQYIIVDGYVYLDDEKKLGLGGYLYDAIEQKVPVIGVAKNHFANNTKYVVEVLRGESQKPLYITAVGTDLEEAAKNVKNMHGTFRFPTLLKELDILTKE